ncbi:hypothetical protein [Polynucleobacter necessarius]|uniref:hypothetical protein n=1 Tax=Polynucleobacter necessarius TaxID=576610 RepID=UPI001E2E6C20|nr:hypothetical protein [Polynucleobacter necessarius]
MPHAQINIDTSATTTGGAITSSPLSNSVSTVGDVIAGPSSSSVGDLTTGSSSSTSLGGSVGNSSTGASSSQGNISGNTTISTSYEAPKIPVATAFSPANHPTAPCMGSTSIGGSAVLFGFSAGPSWEATECMTFEAARSFDQVSMYEDALAIKCTSKYSAAAPSCIKLREQKDELRKKAEALAFDIPQQFAVISNLGASYTETIDPISGFKTIIDTRDARIHPILSR